MDPTGSHLVLTTGTKTSDAARQQSIQHVYVHSSAFTSSPSDISSASLLSKWDRHLNMSPAPPRKRSTRKSSSSSGSGTTFPQCVTSVAWDAQYGTEGGAKRILLGTGRYGRVYEASLLEGSKNVPVSSTSHNATGGPSGGPSTSHSSTTSDDYIALVGTLSTGDDESEFDSEQDQGQAQRPSPLNPPPPPARVDSIFFVRTSTDNVTVLATTSGIGRRTRFHTMTSPPPSSSSSSSSSPQPSATEPQHQTALGAAFAPNAHSSFVELPGSIDGTQMKIIGDDFAFMSEFGIYYGTIDRGNTALSTQNNSKAGGVKDSSILMFEDINIFSPPVGFGLTKYHFVLLESTGTLTFVSRISNKIVQRDRIPELHATSTTPHPPNPELISDARRPGSVWLRRGENLFTVSSPYEERDIWRLRLRKILEGSGVVSPSSNTPEQIKSDEDAFDDVVTLCQNPSERSVVNLCRAEYHLSKERDVLAARWFAKAPKSLASFAATALRLCLPNLLGSAPDDTQTSPSSNAALIAYLTETFTKLNKQHQTSFKKPNDNVQFVMLGAWLTELLLADREASSKNNDAAIGQFLAHHAKNLDSATTLKVLASHDAAPHEIAAAAAASGDYASAVASALGIKNIEQSRAKGAIAAVRILENSEMSKFADVYYRHAAELLSRAPIEAGASFLRRYKDGLDPTKLLPAILHVHRLAEERRELEDDDEDEVGGDADTPHSLEDLIDEAILRYLEGVVKLGCKSTAIHNYLLSLYAELDDEQPLFRYLTSITSSGAPPPLDLPFSLRCVLKTKRHHRSAVKLYVLMGMLRSAVSLALAVDPGLARSLAKNTAGPSQKDLWLLIASHAASDNGDGGDPVDRVISVLRESGSGVLSIEDVLPFLPDFSTIDTFKGEIVAALTVYSEKISSYKDSIAECDLACDDYREEIEAAKGRKVEVERNFRCAISGRDIMVGGERVDKGDHYYAFPSGFKVYDSELRRVVIEVLEEGEREELEVLMKEIEDVSRAVKEEDGRGGLGGLGLGGGVEGAKTANEERLEELKRRYDGIVARECPLTGDIMIDSIGKPIEGWDEDLSTGRGRGGEGEVKVGGQG
ncbi:hypothetical protein TrCOL_g1423 [Triparma columacea]|nr:hypothetical protein TrCOL_g1423 [Triparma columacea]